MAEIKTRNALLHELESVAHETRPGRPKRKPTKKELKEKSLSHFEKALMNKKKTDKSKPVPEQKSAPAPAPIESVVPAPAPAEIPKALRTQAAVDDAWARVAAILKAEEEEEMEKKQKAAMTPPVEPTGTPPAVNPNTQAEH